MSKSIAEFVDALVGKELDEITTTGDIAIVPMGMKKKPDPEDDVDALDKEAKVKD